MLVPSVTRPINPRHIAVLTSLRLGPLSLAFIGPAKWTLLPTEKNQARIRLASHGAPRPPPPPAPFALAGKLHTPTTSLASATTPCS